MKLTWVQHSNHSATELHTELCKFWCEKIKGFGIYGGQILEFPIEMAGHPYNSAALPRSL